MSVYWFVRDRREGERVVTPEGSLFASADRDGVVRLDWTKPLDLEDIWQGRALTGRDCLLEGAELSCVKLEPRIEKHIESARTASQIEELAKELYDYAGLDDLLVTGAVSPDNRLLRRIAWRCRAVAKFQMDLRPKTYNSRPRDLAWDYGWFQVDRKWAYIDMRHPLVEATDLLDLAFQAGHSEPFEEWGRGWLSTAACWLLCWRMHGHEIGVSD